MTGIAALRAGVVALLEAEGKSAAASLVEPAEIDLVSSERWSMGSREVTAQRIALVVSAEDFVALYRDPELTVSIRAAFAAAMRTPETELAELFVVLRLPPILRGWHHAYRDAPAKIPERPTEAAMLAGAASLLEAEGDTDAAELLVSAALEIAEVSAGLVRCVLRLNAEELAALRRNSDRSARVLAAVRAAATRADQSIASVDLAILLA